MALRKTLGSIALQYVAAKIERFSNHVLANAIRTELPNVLKAILEKAPNDLIFKGSAGQGQWAEVPWCAIFNPLITKSAEKGYYLVYLFDTKNNKIYLSLNQGTDSVKKQFTRNALEILEQRASLYRASLFQFEERLPLKTIKDFEGRKATGYATGHILGFEYDVNTLPDEEQLIDDLKLTLNAYSTLIYQDDNIYDDTIETSPTILEHRRYRLHRRIERASGVAKKVKQRLKTTCQCCGLNFAEKYGEIGEGFIEVHHLKPLSSLEPETTLSYDIEKDFAVLCANCHRMLHRMLSKNEQSSLGETEMNDVDRLKKWLR